MTTKPKDPLVPVVAKLLEDLAAIKASLALLARKTFLFRVGLLVSVAINIAQYWGW